MKIQNCAREIALAWTLLSVATWLSATVAQSAQVPWATGFGQRESIPEQNQNAMATDAQGNTYIMGFVRVGTGPFVVGPFSFSPPGAYFAKFGPDGQALLLKQLDAPGLTLLYWSSIAVDGEGNVCAAGRFVGEGTFGTNAFNSGSSFKVIIAKFDSEGNVLWAQQSTGDTQQLGTAVAVDQQNNLVVAGYFRESLTIKDMTLSAPNLARFLTKFSTTGQLVWLRHLGEGLLPVSPATALAIGPTNEIYLAASFTAGARVGNLTAYSYGETDAGVVRFAPDGDATWIFTAGGAAADSGIAVAVDKRGKVALLGHFTSPTVTISNTVMRIRTENGYGVASFVALLDSNGNAERVVPLVPSESDERPSITLGTDLTFDSAGNLTIAGGFGSYLAFANTAATLRLGSETITAIFGSSDAFTNWSFVASVATNGTFQWVMKVMGSVQGGSTIYDLALADRGAIHLFGSYSGRLDIAGEVLPPPIPANTIDLFLARLVPLPSLSIVRSNAHLRVAWPANAADFVLQSASDLRAGTSWQNIAGTSSEAGGQRVMTIENAKAMQFFRLYMP